MGSSIISPAASRIFNSFFFFSGQRNFFFLRKPEPDREIAPALKTDERAPQTVALQREVFSHCFIRHYLNLATCGNFWGKLKRGDYVGGTQGN